MADADENGFVVVDDSEQRTAYHDFHETHEEQFEREQEEDFLVRECNYRTPHQYFTSIIYLGNKSALMLLRDLFVCHEKPPKVVYFCEHNGKIYLTFEPLRPHAIPRTLQSAGRNGEQKRVPLPAELRQKYRTDQYKRVRVKKIKDGVFRLDFTWQTCINEDYWEYRNEYAQKGERAWGERVWRIAERIAEEEKRKELQATLQSQREREQKPIITQETANEDF